MSEYRILAGSPQEKFGELRTKVQVFGGGYGNGKTAAAVVQKALLIAKMYPGANILIARATYPKLNDTIRKEFLKWCPKSWIKSFPLSKNSDNTCTLVNGTTINFRYIAQQGKGVSEGEQTTSNLLSATYDLIIVDQLEDPEITRKDFDDLLGRLRGNARYIGDDPTMPLTGPRWMVVCVNPTRNWVYRTLIGPLIKYEQQGIIDEHLLCLREPRDLDDGSPNPKANQPILGEDGKPQVLISKVEGSTYTNRHNLGEDFIQTLESAYVGQSRDRYLYGEWAAYEGLVHPEFNEVSHCIPRSEMLDYLSQLYSVGYIPQFIEGYDFGMVEPSCYLAAFTDRYKNTFIVDGFYMPEEKMDLEVQKRTIHQTRRELGIEDEKIWADPAIFRKTQLSKAAGSKTIARLFEEGTFGVRMRAADNEVLRGITKVNTYLAIKPTHRHPITGAHGAPHLFIASELEFVLNEYASYYWKQDKSGQRIDEPIDKNDHAMDTIKYMLAKQPDVALRIPKPIEQRHLRRWGEVPDTKQVSRHRYG